MKGRGGIDISNFSVQIIENLEEAVGILNSERKIIYSNKSLINMLGYSFDELYETDLLDLVRENKREAATRRFDSCLKGKKVKESIWEIRTETGNYRLCAVNCLSFSKNEDRYLAFLIYDNTEKEELKRIKSSFDNIYFELGAEPDKNIRIIVKRACEILRGTCSLYNRVEFDKDLLVTWAGYNIPPDYVFADKPGGHICFEEVVKGSRDVVVIKNLEGTGYEKSDSNVVKYKLKAYIGSSVSIQNEKIGSLCVVFNKPREFRKEEIDIMYTLAKALSLEEMRKETETRLKGIIQEKEYLMKEMNHRVKNNLQMITSLINIKENSSESGDFSDLIHQIDAIRIIHEKLYSSGDVRNIEITEYYKKLIETIFESFSNEDIKINMNIEKLTMNSRQLATSGLIINEIATNSIKYAYKDCRKPEFTLSVKSKGVKGCEMRIGNNGEVIPEEISLDYPKTLGMRLIAALTKQLNGSVELKRKPRTEYIIKFEIEK